MNEVIGATKSWIEDFVVGLNLCPFAAHPFTKQKIQFEVCESIDSMQQRLQLYNLVLKLNNSKAEEISNCFLIFPHELTFDSCLNIRDDVSELLRHYHLHEQFQLIVFHPQFKFADGRKPSSHLVNQSPYPMVHILRQSEVNQAIETFGDVARIMEENDSKLLLWSTKKDQDLPEG